MKRYIVAAMIVLSCWYAWLPVPAMAHFLITDGTIGMILHVDPNDDPAVGGNSTFYLDFKDKTNRFSFDKCTCNFVLSQNNQQVYQTLLEQPLSPLSYVLHYTFPSKGIYHLAVKGQPINAGDFDNFLLEYDVRVARGGGQAQANDNKIALWVYGLWAVVGLGIIGGVTVFVKRSKKNQQERS